MNTPQLRKALATSALLLLALAVTPAAAWGPVGHRAVGAIADELLSPAAQAAVAGLLADDRDRDGRPSRRHTLAEVANWADEIRRGPADHPRWHYDDMPVCERAGSPSSWCARGECASAKEAEQLALLADARRSRTERNEALKWVVHLTADLHQPLHAADLAQGGNKILVAPYGRSRQRPSTPASGHEHEESLHAFWDTRLVTLALHPHAGQIPAASLQRLLELARAQDPALVAASPGQWAAESNEIARSFALNIEGIGCDAPAEADALPVVNLSRAYVTRGKQIVEDRLALAGARLAHVLDEAFAERP